MQNMIQSLTKQPSYKGRVILIPFGPENQQYVRLADLHISASSHESYPLNTLEAMAMGVPVVATDAGGTGEQFRSERTRELLVTDVNSRSDFIQKVLYASHLHQQGLLRSLGLEFCKAVTEHSVEEFGHRLEQIINRIQMQTTELTDCGLWDLSLTDSGVGQQCVECSISPEIDTKKSQLKEKNLQNQSEVSAQTTSSEAQLNMTTFQPLRK